MANFIFFQSLIFVFVGLMAYFFACLATLYSPAWLFVAWFFVAFARNFYVEYEDYKADNNTNQGNKNV